MFDTDVLIIGAGPAGLAAAIEISRAGLSCRLIEQRETIGGAIYRQGIAGAAAVHQAPSVKARWRRLAQTFERLGLPVQHGSVFLGIDGDGLAIIENRQTGMVEHLTARAVIVATGAVENVMPRPGWQMAGISTVGGLQVMMKETGTAPAGRVMLAGNGPLLLAVAAQMARLGNPPVAVVEAGDPLRHPLSGLKLAAHPLMLWEALFYLKDVWLRKIRWLRATTVLAIERDRDALVVTLRNAQGVEQRIVADRVGLHDGIRPNDYGLPEQSVLPQGGPMLVRAGDCREALGAVAAEADGRRMGRQVVDRLKAAAVADASLAIDRQRRAQAILKRLFRPADQTQLLARLPDETILCRCENRTLADLKALCSNPDPLSGREVKHNGRFAMGACQGRFCAENTARLMAELRPDMPTPVAGDLVGRRWPLRPVSIGALVRAFQDKSEQK